LTSARSPRSKVLASRPTAVSLGCALPARSAPAGTLEESIMDASSTDTGRDAYTLQEIADWQLKAASGDVILPDLQRGFVWKPFQTENLWDSLLRRFPVGTFILAPSHKSDQLELLDGQQRATAIAFGFFDPWAPDFANQGYGAFATRQIFQFFGSTCFPQTTLKLPMFFVSLLVPSRGAMNERTTKRP
jgi:hypothetical protein